MTNSPPHGGFFNEKNMQKTLISISKGKEGPIATLIYPNRVKTETSAIGTALWTSALLGLWQNREEYDHDDNQTELTSLVSISLRPEGLTLASDDQELSLSNYKHEDIAHLMRTAMSLLGQQESIKLSDLTDNLKKKHEQKKWAHNKLPI
jgi:hypothetical protein